MTPTLALPPPPQAGSPRASPRRRSRRGAARRRGGGRRPGPSCVHPDRRRSVRCPQSQSGTRVSTRARAPPRA
ncbi:hypothetical protein ACFPRL_14035 [Pseudoclavibacter helvolus]